MKNGTLLHCWWDCKLTQLLWKSVGRLLKKLKIETPFDSCTCHDHATSGSFRGIPMWAVLQTLSVTSKRSPYSAAFLSLENVLFLCLCSSYLNLIYHINCLTFDKFHDHRRVWKKKQKLDHGGPHMPSQWSWDHILKVVDWKSSKWEHGSVFKSLIYESDSIRLC